MCEREAVCIVSENFHFGRALLAESIDQVRGYSPQRRQTSSPSPSCMISPSLPSQKRSFIPQRPLFPLLSPASPPIRFILRLSSAHPHSSLAPGLCPSFPVYESSLAGILPLPAILPG